MLTLAQRAVFQAEPSPPSTELLTVSFFSSWGCLHLQVLCIGPSTVPLHLKHRNTFPSFSGLAPGVEQGAESLVLVFPTDKPIKSS